MPSGNFDFKSEQKHPYMEAFGHYMAAFGTFIKTDKHGAELENTGPALRAGPVHSTAVVDGRLRFQI